ncbi:MAG: DUF4062 domain-containing protein [Planctomycetaceae bacterium]|jgi:hypothetical protein|nr:DUF4062 domain-containing protein [Planctomycetaceae bacterium]
MPYNAAVYRVFIASPDDVSTERRIVRDVLDEWNTVHSLKENVVLLPVGWETHSYPEMGDNPQNILDKQMLSNADLLIGVFGNRLGTPTEKYQSGTVQETNEHIDSGKPVMLYFSDCPVNPSEIDKNQRDELNKFKDEIRDKGYFKSYKSHDEFRSTLLRDISLIINDNLYFKLRPHNYQSTQNIQEPEIKLSEESKQLLITVYQNDSNIMYLQYLGGAVIQIGQKAFSTQEQNFTKLERALRKLVQLHFIEIISEGNGSISYKPTEDGAEYAEKLLMQHKQ